MPVPDSSLPPLPDGVTTPARPAGPPRVTVGTFTLEICAIVMLGLGSLFIPFMGWLVGVVLLWTSRRFRRVDKVLGTLVWPFGATSLFFAYWWASKGSLDTTCDEKVNPVGRILDRQCDVSATPGSVLLTAVLLVSWLAVLGWLVRRVVLAYRAGS